jgi:hypothetical protein
MKTWECDGAPVRLICRAGGESVMRKVKLLPLIAFSLLLAFPGCTLRPQIKYDPERMPGFAAHTGRELRPGDFLTKADITRVLGDLDPKGLDPQDFLVDTNAVARIFAPKRSDLFSFVIIADPQIEDRSFRFSPRLTRFLDKPVKIETTVRGFIQDHADVFYFGFVLKAIRLGLEMNPNLDLVVDVGDVMHVGRKPELAAFNEMIGKFLIAGCAAGWENNWVGTWLDTPIMLPDGRECRWLNMIGNHDVLLLGNFCGNPFIWVPGGAITSLGKLYHTLEVTAPFNSTCRSRCGPVRGQGTACNGYYRVDRRMADGRLVRLVVLNTSESVILDPLIPKLQRGACYPSLSGEQFDWLRNTLAEAQTNDSIGLVLVFGHYPLLQVTVNRTGKRPDRDRSYGEVSSLLGEFPKVNAYFCGHLHSGSPPKERRCGNHMFVEYICPSLQEFPKSFEVASVGKNPISGEYTTIVKYYNLEDLMDLTSLPSLEPETKSGCEVQQKRLVEWLVGLHASTTNRVQRIQLLAKCCYLSAIDDVQNDRRTDIGICFNPKHARRLMEEYRGGQELWLQIKYYPYWPEVRRTLETRAPSTSPAQSVARFRDAQVHRPTQD